MKIRQRQEEVEINSTPFINVVFCMILFFMVTYSPRSQKGALSTYLPKNVGINPTDTPVEQLQENENISIYINYNKMTNKYYYGIGSPDEKDIRSVVSYVANIIKERSADNVPPIKLSPAKNVGWEGITQLMSELKHISPKIKDIELSSPQ